MLQYCLHVCLFFFAQELPQRLTFFNTGMAVRISILAKVGFALDMGRQILYLQFSGVGQGRGAGYDILQFPDITRPTVGAQCLYNFFRQLYFAFQFSALLDGEVLCEQGDIGASVAERWNFYRDDAQPVVEIFAEIAGIFLGFQIFVGGGDDSDIDRDVFISSNRSHLAFLEGAEEFALQVVIQDANFIEENGAGAGFFEQAGAILVSAGKSAGFMAKKF